jgi:hypothetical protein
MSLLPFMSFCCSIRSVQFQLLHLTYGTIVLDPISIYNHGKFANNSLMLYPCKPVSLVDGPVFIQKKQTGGLQNEKFI